jgi:Fe-S-cluster-containing dehydrogenase component
MSSSRKNEGLSRRRFMGLLASAGGAALLGPVAEAGALQPSGWPKSYGVLTDLTLCVGCRSCEKACQEANNLPPPEVPFDDEAVFQELRRPTAKAYTVVNRYENPKDKQRPIYRKVQCNHCNEPACASACPIHAYTKTPEGAVLYDPDKCFGCRYCMIACPFYVPAYDYESALEPKVVKCILCHGRIKEGRLPACVEACPVGALTFGRRTELLRLARRKLLHEPQRYIQHIYGEHEVGGTSWLYISGVPFEQLGFPANLPKEPLIKKVKGFLSAVPVVFVVWPALFSMCYAALRHREEAGQEKDKGQEG